MPTVVRPQQTAAGWRGGLVGACSAAVAVAAFLAVGQAVGHLTLSYASGHAHELTARPAMLLAHLGATLACAVLICAAERLWSALATYVWRLVRALTATASADQAPCLVSYEAETATPRFRLGCTAGTRGPPPLFV